MLGMVQRRAGSQERLAELEVGFFPLLRRSLVKTAGGF